MSLGGAAVKKKGAVKRAMEMRKTMTWRERTVGRTLKVQLILHNKSIRNLLNIGPLQITSHWTKAQKKIKMSLVVTYFKNTATSCCS